MEPRGVEENQVETKERINGERIAPSIGQLAGVGPAGEILVAYRNFKPRAARFLSSISRIELSKPENLGREVLLLFEGGDPDRPIIIGLMENPLEEMVSIEFSGDARMNQWLAKGHENPSPSPLSPPVEGGEVPYLPSPLAGEGEGEGGFSGQTSMSQNLSKNNENNPTIPPLEKGGKGGFEREFSDEPSEKPKEALVDGKRVTIEAEEEVILKCGAGSITLRKDGKIVIKGTHLLSRSSGPNRIKGGSVNIN